VLGFQNVVNGRGASSGAGLCVCVLEMICRDGNNIQSGIYRECKNTSSLSNTENVTVTTRTDLSHIQIDCSWQSIYNFRSIVR